MLALLSVITDAGTASSADIISLFTIGANGQITYNRNNPLFDALDDGESIIVNVSYSVNSGPDSATRMITLEVQGSNDAPYFTSPAEDFEGADIVEHADNSPDEIGDVDHVQSFVLNFDDVELGDAHSTTIIPVTDVDTPALADYIGTFAAGFPTVAQGAGEGAVTFQFTVADSVIDNLTEGETITQRYQVQIE